MSVRNFVPSEDNKESLGKYSKKWKNTFTYKINDFNIPNPSDYTHSSNSIVVTNDNGEIHKNCIPLLTLDELNSKITNAKLVSEKDLFIMMLAFEE